MWTRHAETLGAAIAAQCGVAADDLACAALARFVLDVPALTRNRTDRRAAVDEVFDIIERGWKPPGRNS